jgi:thiamine-monophosphate kinase
MKLRDLGEFGFIERIRARVGTTGDLVLGIGDDCAALRVPPEHLLLTTTDLLIEDVHFRRIWCDLRTLGRKSVNVNLSDIAAMGGQPVSLYLGLGIPEAMSVEELDQFAAGLIEACREHGVLLAGGDTCRSPGPFFISVTVEGRVPQDQLLTRSGARVDDVLWVSGTLGDSALALRRLLAGEPPTEQVARRHHDPSARVALGRALAEQGLATAMIDVSDGLLADLGHILDSSAVGALVECDQVPVSHCFREALGSEGELMELALSGGEDYELLFTSPPACRAAVAALATEDVALTPIGRILSSAQGLQLVDAQGHLLPHVRSGFNHFG